MDHLVKTVPIVPGFRHGWTSLGPSLLPWLCCEEWPGCAQHSHKVSCHKVSPTILFWELQRQKRVSRTLNIGSLIFFFSLFLNLSCCDNSQEGFKSLLLCRKFDSKFTLASTLHTLNSAGVRGWKRRLNFSGWRLPRASEGSPTAEITSLSFPSSRCLSFS